MTELETIQRAKMYLDKLANGIDPLTGAPVPEGDLVNNVRISRCFSFVSDVLQRIIERGGVSAPQSYHPTQPFSVSPEALRGYVYPAAPISVSEIARRINALIDLSTSEKLKYTSITSFLVQSGLLEKVTTPDGRSTRRPTPAGNAIGIFTEERIGRDGNYLAVLYDRSAQQYLLDNIDAIAELNDRSRQSASPPSPQA